MAVPYPQLCSLLQCQLPKPRSIFSLKLLFKHIIDSENPLPIFILTNRKEYFIIRVLIVHSKGRVHTLSPTSGAICCGEAFGNLSAAPCVPYFHFHCLCLHMLGKSAHVGEQTLKNTTLYLSTLYLHRLHVHVQGVFSKLYAHHGTFHKSTRRITMQTQDTL